MISLRYHAVSIAAVFLALAVGVVLGASGVSDRLLAAVSTQRDGLNGRVAQLTAERDALAAPQRAATSSPAGWGPRPCAACCSGSPSRWSSPAPTPRPRRGFALLQQAGATVTGRSRSPTPSATRPGPTSCASSRPAAAAGAQLPAASDTGSLVGGLLGGVLPARDSRPQVARTPPAGVLTGLTSAGFVSPGDNPGAANLVLVLTGGSLTGADAADGAAVYAGSPRQLDRSGAGAVLAGRSGSAEATGAVGVVRADPQVAAGLSTVDDVQAGAGRVAAVLALREQADGRAGRYGTGAGAATAPRPRREWPCPLRHAREPEQVVDRHDRRVVRQEDALVGGPAARDVEERLRVRPQLADERLRHDPAADGAERVACSQHLGLLEHVVPERRRRLEPAVDQHGVEARRVADRSWAGVSGVIPSSSATACPVGRASE